MKVYGKIIILLCVMIWFPALCAQEIDSLSSLHTFLSSGTLDRAGTSVLIMDLSTGDTVVAYNASRPLIPASTMKLVTTAALFPKVRMDEKFATKVYMQGELSDGVLNGNLLIVGSGDPTLNSDVAPRAPDFIGEIVNALRNKGIREIEGQIRVDQTVYGGPATPASWGENNRRQYYGAGAFGFNFERNKKGSVSVNNPVEVFRNKLIYALGNAGINVRHAGVDSRENELLFIHYSAPYDEIMRSCMMRSDNLYAECQLRQLGLRSYGDGTIDNGLKASREYWRSLGLNLNNVRMLDGSGLSRDDRLTADFLSQVLAYMSDEPYYASFFPLAGEEGTLRNFLKSTPLEGYVAMKTGSMNGVQTFAGYLLDENYEPTHTIVIMMNSFASRPAARRAAEKLLLDTFN